MYSCCTCPQQTGSVLVWKFRQIAKFESVLRGAGCPGSTVERWSSVFISVPPWCSWVIHEQPGVKQTHMRSQLSPLSWDSEPPCCLYGLPAIRSSCFSAGNSHLCWAIMELRGWNTNCAFWECVCCVCGVTFLRIGPGICVQPAINWNSCKYHLYNYVYSMCAFLSSCKCHFKTQSLFLGQPEKKLV